MEIEIYKKKEGIEEWEYMVILGHDSRDVGFLVKLNVDHWQELTGGKRKPEFLIKKTFQFLLKKQSTYSIARIVDLQKVQEQFPDYRDTIRSV